MKKILTLATTFILALAFALPLPFAAAQEASSVLPQPEDVIGTWHLNAIEYLGVTMTSIGITRTFNEDGSMISQIVGEEDETGTWSINAVSGKIGMFDDSGDLISEYTLTGGYLSIEIEGGTLIFGREEVDTFGFIGTWHLDAVEMGNRSISPATVGIDMTILVRSNGTMHISSLLDGEKTGVWAIDSEGQITTWTFNNDHFYQAEDETATLVDGKLMIEIDDLGTFIFIKEDAADTEDRGGRRHPN